MSPIPFASQAILAVIIALGVTLVCHARPEVPGDSLNSQHISSPPQDCCTSPSSTLSQSTQVLESPNSPMHMLRTMAGRVISIWTCGDAINNMVLRTCLIIGDLPLLTWPAHKETMFGTGQIALCSTRPRASGISTATAHWARLSRQTRIRH